MRIATPPGTRRHYSRKVKFPWIKSGSPARSSPTSAEQKAEPPTPEVAEQALAASVTASTPEPQGTHQNQMAGPAQAEPVVGIPSLFTSLPPIRDLLTTETSNTQDATVEQCLPFLKGTADPSKLPFDFNEHGLPRLDRENHVIFLRDSLEAYPAHFVGLDASRPWMLYWALTALSLLGEDVTSFRESVIATFTPLQNPTGGFGGGHGQMSHCASSYAAVLSLALVGGDDALGLINRKTMWEWLGRLKQRDGGFQVCEGAEEDVRGAYCAMTMVSLLNLPVELPPDCKAKAYGLNTLTSGLPEWLSRCQTFEGGISCAPGTEAHGGFAFCAVAGLCILGEPQQMITKYLDVARLASWLSARQYAPEGGFSGRTNKLVDGCYSHWVGGCWPLLEAALNGKQTESTPPRPSSSSLYSREGLIRYILCCCQSKHGGLRDKPGKHPDSYHSCYTLAGLSSAQHYAYYTDASETEGPFASAFSWRSSPVVVGPDGREDVGIFDAEDRVNPIHPLFVISHAAVTATRRWSKHHVDI